MLNKSAESKASNPNSQPVTLTPFHINTHATELPSTKKSVSTDSKISPPKMRQGTLWDSHMSNSSPIRTSQSPSSFSAPAAESNGTAAVSPVDEKHSDHTEHTEDIEKSETEPKMSAREKRRREYDAARDQNLGSSSKDKENDGSDAAPSTSENDKSNPPKKKRRNKELENLTQWMDWIADQCDKKSAAQKEEARRLEMSDSPPRRRRTKSSNAGSTSSRSSKANGSVSSVSSSSAKHPAAPVAEFGSKPSSASSSHKTSWVQKTSVSPRTSVPPQPTASANTSTTGTPATGTARNSASSTSSALADKHSASSHSSTSQPEATAPRLMSPPPIQDAGPDSISGTSTRPSVNKLTLKLKPFVEPVPSEPIMSVTGLPLGSNPSAKIKKESLWPQKKGTKSRGAGGRRKKSESVEAESDASEASPEAELLSHELIEAQLNQKLMTRVNEQLQQPSELRSSLRVPPSFNDQYVYDLSSTSVSPSPDIPETPKAATRGKKNGKSKKTTEKRNIKNASPKKHRENPFGFENPLSLAGEKRDTAFDFSDATKDNEDFCAACGEPGIFLCCERCPKSFHFACCDPPFDESTLPEGEWFCNECRSKKDPPPLHPPGLFSKLLDQVDRRNPTQFRLPKNIRERFSGVVTGQFGEYEDSNMKPFKPAKIGSLQELAPGSHYDKDGKALVCIKCGETGISPNKLMGEVDKPIVTCEFCPCSWHLDCLSPPLASAKQLGKKWKCPNHADELIPRKRRLRRAEVVDVDLTRGFSNDGHVEVKLDSSDSDNDDQPETVNIPTPPHLANYDTSNGVAALPNKAQEKLWKDDFVVYRLPERGIVLDFMSKVKQDKEAERDRKINDYYNITRENHKLLQQLVSDPSADQKRKETVAALVELKEADFRELVKVAKDEIGDDEDEEISDAVDEDELKVLLEIKKLMALKGKKKLLEFLKQ